MGTQYTNAVPAIVPDEEDLPGWVPKNYIEKGIKIEYYVYYSAISLYNGSEFAGLRGKSSFKK